MLFYSHILGAAILGTEGLLAWMAFGKFNNYKEEDCPFPFCSISNLYNENFVNIPFIGQVVNFYPFLNCAAAPILLITLRNNLFESLNLKALLKKIGFSDKMLSDSPGAKGFWSIVI